MKFNSQVCTTKIQSERLLALGLKKETADMVLLKELAYDEKRHCLCDADTYMIRPIDYLNGEEHRGNIPAWSLHRLKCLLPDKTPYGDGYLTVEIINENVYIVLVIEKVEQRLLKYTIGNLYDNLISCIDFFVRESLFNKEYLEKK